MTEQVNVKNDAGAQSRGAEGGTNLTVRLGFTFSLNCHHVFCMPQYSRNLCLTKTLAMNNASVLHCDHNLAAAPIFKEGAYDCSQRCRPRSGSLKYFYHKSSRHRGVGLNQQFLMSDTMLLQ